MQINAAILGMCASFACFWGHAFADSVPTRGKFSDRKTIELVLASIPAADKSLTYRNLSERLAQLGLTVTYIDAAPFGSADISISGGTYKVGDIDYQFRMTQPDGKLLSICPVWSSFGFIRRGSKWLPETRTAVFLSSGRCDAPKL